MASQPPLPPFPRPSPEPPPAAAEVSRFSCRSCGAEVVVGAFERTARCPYCDSPAVVDRPAAPDRPDPVFAIGFRVDRAAAAARVHQFLRGRRWAPNALRRAVAAKLEGIYLPTYLFSARADSGFGAAIGEVYYENRLDPRRTSQRRDRKIEWHELSGAHSCYLADVVVTASRGAPNDEVEAIEPFDLRDLRRYTPGLIAGWLAEEPSLAEAECRELARTEARAEIRNRLAAFQPGDTHRDLRCSTELSDESLDLALLPVWVVAVRYSESKPPVRLLVNGQTGRVGGRTPISWAKVGAVAATGLGLLLLALLWNMLS